MLEDPEASKSLAIENDVAQLQERSLAMYGILYTIYKKLQYILGMIWYPHELWPITNVGQSF